MWRLYQIKNASHSFVELAQKNESISKKRDLEKNKVVEIKR